MRKGLKYRFAAAAAAIALVLTAFAILPAVNPAAGEAYAETPVYTLNAAAVPGQPGVYKVTAAAGASKDSDTIGIPSIAADTLADHATTELPAIIMGAAVNYEIKTGPVNYVPKEGAQLIAPYSYFRYTLTEEPDPNGTGTHIKLGGFDGS